MKSKKQIIAIGGGGFTHNQDNDLDQFFLDKINYGYFHKAKYNIFIPNQQYFHKNQIEFLDCFDMIFAKELIALL